MLSTCEHIKHVRDQSQRSHSKWTQVLGGFEPIPSEADIRQLTLVPKRHTAIYINQNEEFNLNPFMLMRSKKWNS